MYLIDKDREDPRRRILIQMWVPGMLGAASPAALAQVANILAAKPAAWRWGNRSTAFPALRW